MERAQGQPSRPELQGEELEREMAQLQQEARKKLAADAAQVQGIPGEHPHQEEEESRKLSPGALALRVVVGLIAFLLLWSLVLEPLLYLALTIGFVALVGWGSYQLYQLSQPKEPS